MRRVFGNLAAEDLLRGSLVALLVFSTLCPPLTHAVVSSLVTGALAGHGVSEWLHWKRSPVEARRSPEAIRRLRTAAVFLVAGGVLWATFWLRGW